jgi:hypothetical protein
VFAPSRDEVRSFFVETWRKHREGLPLVGLELVAVDVLLAHPEYREMLEAPDALGATSASSRAS